MSVLNERPIHRAKNPVYEISLSIYPVAVCGEDLQTGSPIEVSAEGEDLYAMKLRVKELVLSVVKEDGKCFVEMQITKNGEYFDRDEWWCFVYSSDNRVEGGHYES